MREHLSQLFLEIEGQIGTRDTAELVLDALLETIRDYDIKDDKKFCEKFEEVIKDIKNTTPRIGLVIEDFYEIWKELEREEHCKKHLDCPRLKCKDLKRSIKNKVKALKKQNRKSKKSITAHTIREIKKGDTILIHTNSHTILDALKAARRKKRFSCIVAEQEHEKTMSIILDLQKSKIPFKVVPEYMLSHIEDEVSKVFIGGVTLNSFHHVVSNAGTKAIAAEFHRKVPIYLLMGTRKCSFWNAKTLHHSYQEKQIKSTIHSETTYSRIKFSHDRIPMEMFDFAITEKGTMTGKAMLKWYKEEFTRRAPWRKAFFSIP